MTRSLLGLKPALRLEFGNGAFLRPLVEADVTDAYVEGLNDPNVNRYLEVRKVHQTLALVRRYVNQNTAASDAVLFGIYSDGALRGTLRLHDVDVRQSVATMGIALFDRSAQGKGLGPRAIGAVVRFAATELNLDQLRAGIIDANTRSIRAFEKEGFRRTGDKEPDPEHGTAGWWTLELSGKAPQAGQRR